MLKAGDRLSSIQLSSKISSMDILEIKAEEQRTHLDALRTQTLPKPSLDVLDGVAYSNQY